LKRINSYLYYVARSFNYALTVVPWGMYDEGTKLRHWYKTIFEEQQARGQDNIYFYEEISFTPIIHLWRRIMDMEKILEKKNILLRRANGRPPRLHSLNNRHVLKKVGLLLICNQDNNYGPSVVPLFFGKPLVVVGLVLLLFHTYFYLIIL